MRAGSRVAPSLFTDALLFAIGQAVAGSTRSIRFGGGFAWSHQGWAAGGEGAPSLSSACRHALAPARADASTRPSSAF